MDGSFSYFLSYWYYFLPDYLLAIVMWSLIGRFVLFFFVAKNPQRNLVYSAFSKITDWFLLLIRPLTPRFLAVVFLPLYGAFLVLVIRVIFGVSMLNLGLTPSVVPQ